MRSRPRAPAALAKSLALLVTVIAAPAAAQSSAPGSRLASFWQTWLEQTRPLMSEEERLYFGILENDVAREHFAAGFWRSRGPEALERWRRNGEDARRMRSRSSARSLAVRLVGKPDSIEPFQRCGPLRRLEVWTWQPWQLAIQNGEVTDPQHMIFVEATTLSMSSFHPWRPADLEGLVRGLAAYSSPDELIEALGSGSCIEGGALSRLSQTLERAISFDDLRRLAPWPEPGPGWLAKLRERTPAETGFPATLELDFPGAFTRYTILRGRVEVPTERLTQLVPGLIFDRITMVGDLFHDGRLADSFEIVEHIAGTSPGARVVLDFYRRLLPGTHRLRLRVADRDGLALLREDLELEVPLLTEAATEPAGRAEGFSRLTRSDLVELATFPSLELLPPVADARGRQVARAITTGGPIASVEFRVGGETVAIDDRPPYTQELAEPEVETTLSAFALDPDHRVLAQDSRPLAPGGRAFSVRFGAVRAGQQVVAVDVGLPAGGRIESFECRRSRRLLHSATGPPFECPLPEAALGGADYLTARVVLAGGDSQEDVLFLGSRRSEQVDVQLAELYLSILDRTGRPARGLKPDDLRVWESGKARPVVRLEPVEKLPLNVAVLMDISSSMGRSLHIAAGSAQDFFETVLTEGDLASLLAFNHDLHLLVPFTGDSEALRYGAAGLKAWGATRLNDAAVWALFQFSGRTSRRALIVLSDGSDVGSDFQLDQVVELAVRAGVVVYPISLGRIDEIRPEGLARLAAATGGRAFVAAAARDLPGVYLQIAEELRAQYLLVYEPAAALAFELPDAEIEILREGYRAREVRRHTP